jgi:hypothetical protein
MSRAVLSNLDLGGVARVVGLLDPSSAQDAATRAYVLARAPEDLLANIQVTPGGGTGAGGVYLASDLAALISATATNVCFDIQADGDVVIAGLPWPSSQPNAGTAAPMRMLTLSKSNAGTTRRLVISHYSALEATIANRVAIPRETSSLVIASRLETRTFRNMAPTNSGGRYWVLIDGMGARENYLDNVAGDVPVHDGKEYTKTNLAGLVTSAAAGTTKGRKIDGAAGIAIDLTGAEQGQNIRFAFTQVLTLSAGTYHDVEIDVRAKIVEVVPTGDVIITGFKMVLNPLAPGAVGTPGTARPEGNAGAFFTLYKHGFTGRLMLGNYTGSAAANQIGTPSQVEWVLEHASAGSVIRYSATYSKFQPAGKPSAQTARNGAGFGARDITNWVEGLGVSIAMADNTTLRATNVTLSVAPLTANKAVRYTYHVPYAAGSAGARDVLLTLGETFNQRIVRVVSMVNVAQAASSGQLRSATAGGGSALSFAVATTATATTTDDATRLTPNDVVAGTPIYWALTDGRVAGDIFVDCLRY